VSDALTSVTSAVTRPDGHETREDAAGDEARGAPGRDVAAEFPLADCAAADGEGEVGGLTDGRGDSRAKKSLIGSSDGIGVAIVRLVVEHAEPSARNTPMAASRRIGRSVEPG